MEIIPLITMKKRKILENNKSKDVLENISSDSKLYIYDLDGINKDKPNLCTLQRLAGRYELWMDSGPRDLGDVVDSILAGADHITIRSSLYPQMNLEEIKEITENRIFTDIDFDIKNFEHLNMLDVDGFVNFNTEKDIENNNYINLKQFKIQKPIYVFENNPLNISYWKDMGIEYLLVNANKVEEFNRWLQKQK